MHNPPSADVLVLCKNRAVLEGASFAVPGKDPKTFYLCANPVFSGLAQRSKLLVRLMARKNRIICLQVLNWGLPVLSLNSIWPVLNCVSP